MEVLLKTKSRTTVCVYFVSQSWSTLCDIMKPTRLPCPWGFSRQEYWSGLLCPPLGDLPHPGIKPLHFLHLLHWQAGSLTLLPPTHTHTHIYICNGIFLNHKKEWISAICNNVHGLGGYFAQWIVRQRKINTG